jgi:integrase
VAWSSLVAAVREAAASAVRDAMRRDAGAYVPTPEVSPLALLQVSAVIDRWAKEKKPTPKTEQEARKAFALFIEKQGDLSIAAITKAHGVAYKGDLLALHDAPGTVRKKFGLVKAVLQYAADNDLLKANPWDGIKMPTKGAKIERREFTVKELATLLAHPYFTEGQTDRGAAGAALFWMTLMSLHSGARAEELGQLRVTDFHEAPSLGWYYEIHERVEGNSTKNDESKRIVPVHPTLVGLGLLRYVDTMKERNAEWLFPLLKDRTDMRGRSAALSTKFGRVMDAVGLTDPSLVFHSLRHTFRTFALESGITGDVGRAIMGHEDGDVHSDYGSVSVKARFAAMQTYRIEGLAMEAIKPPKV